MRIPVFLSKISPREDFIRNHSYFFYFWTWISLIFLEFWLVFTNLLAGKFETLVVFMKFEKKKLKPIWRLGWALGPPLRPPLRASRSAPALGPSGVTEKFKFIFLSGFMKPPKVSIFAPTNIRETPETIKKINETRSQKKICVVSL